jgi:hypothetical protein
MVKLLTKNETVKDGLTVWFVFLVAPDPGERIVMPQLGEQGVAAPYAWGVSEGIPTRKMAIRSGTVINRLWLFIFFVWHSGQRSISLIQVARMREAGILNQGPLG